MYGKHKKQLITKVAKAVSSNDSLTLVNANEFADYLVAYRMRMVVPRIRDHQKGPINFGSYPDESVPPGIASGMHEHGSFAPWAFGDIPSTRIVSGGGNQFVQGLAAETELVATGQLDGEKLSPILDRTMNPSGRAQSLRIVELPWVPCFSGPAMTPRLIRFPGGTRRSKAGRIHAEWFEYAFLHQGFPGSAGNFFRHATGHQVAQVGIVIASLFADRSFL